MTARTVSTEQLEYLAALGGRFCKVAPRDKKPFENGWQVNAYALDDILSHVATVGNVGLVTGTASNNLVLLDADADFSGFCSTFPRLASGPTIVRDGPDKGKIIIRIDGPCPDGRKFYRPGETQPFFEVLSTGNQGVIPPSIHPEGMPYRLINLDAPVPEITAKQLSGICLLWAGQGLDLEPDAPIDYRPPKNNYPYTNGDGLREKVLDYWTPFKVFDHFGYIKSGTHREGEWIRIYRNGGLFVHNDGQGWNKPGERIGGGAFEAWLYCKTGACSVPKDSAFHDLLVEMAEAAGIDVPKHKERNGAAPGPDKPKGEDKKSNAPNDPQLADRWISEHPDTAYGIGEFWRYGEGIWNIYSSGRVESEISKIVEVAAFEGYRPTNSRVRSVMDFAKWKCLVDDERWDADIDTLVCSNGALHIPTLELRPHDPKYFITSKLDYPYTPGARDDVFEYLLNSCVPDARDFLQEFAGYSLTTDMKYEIALWFYGPPGSGKSTLIAALQAMLGKRAGLLSLADIERSRFALTNLPGKTLVVSAEQPGGFIESTNTLNALVSGEPLPVERKFRDPVIVIPRCKLLWAMNEYPRVSDPDNGIFRRMKIISFPKLAEKDRDPSIKEHIVNDPNCHAAILNWALVGLDRLRARGKFLVPECVASASKEFQERNDIPAQFVEEACITGPDYRTQGSKLFEAYATWCDQARHKPMGKVTIAHEWRRLGFDKHMIDGKSFWFGVGLLEK